MADLTLWPLLLYAGLVLALTVAEYRKDRRAQLLFKPLAALGFLLLALQSGALDSPYGQIIFAALLLCALGDMLLLSRNSQGLFTAGIFAFLLGHLGLAAGFYILGLSNAGLLAGLVAALIISGVFWKTLYPKVPADMKTAVTIYMVVIAAMTVTAFGAGHQSGHWIIALGAVMFAISDIFVARDRFVDNLPINALIITPLYFSAQAIFALSV